MPLLAVALPHDAAAQLLAIALRDGSGPYFAVELPRDGAAPLVAVELARDGTVPVLNAELAAPPLSAVALPMVSGEAVAQQAQAPLCAMEVSVDAPAASIAPASIVPASVAPDSGPSEVVAPGPTSDQSHPPSAT
jgi:hypothetical protein